MSMEHFNVFEFIWGLILIPIGWIWNRQVATQKELAEHKEEVAKHYVPRHEIDHKIDKLNDTIRLEFKDMKVSFKEDITDLRTEIREKKQ